jgi:hypothetical protein
LKNHLSTISPLIITIGIEFEITVIPNVKTPLPQRTLREKKYITQRAQSTRRIRYTSGIELWTIVLLRVMNFYQYE